MYGQDDLRVDGGAADGEDSFTAKTPLQRAFVLVAGVIMNLLLALLIFTVVAVGHGRGVNAITIGEVVPDSPAAAAGWQPSDKLISVGGEQVKDLNQLRNLIEDYAGRDMPVVLERNGQQIATTVVPREDPPSGQGRTGVLLQSNTVGYDRVPLWRAPVEGVRLAWETFTLQVNGLRQLIAGQFSPRDLVGPVGMGQLTGEIVERSTIPLWVTLANLAGFLSLNLFILNLLPFPALDGGRLVFVVLEMLRGGRKIAPEREGMVHFVGLMVLLTLMFVIGFSDIMRLVRGDSFIP
jgi:regulator of sigma E protease